KMQTVRWSLWDRSTVENGPFYSRCLQNFVKQESEINFVQKKSSDENNVFQIVGQDGSGGASTVGYEMTMNIASGCIVTKFELIGAE
ncbi:hypothetical protein K2X05_14300, partial [bacterium]|nr:hypothetical protein [bacterium]